MAARGSLSRGSSPGKQLRSPSARSADGTVRALGSRALQGRITARQLPLAEKSCPGIGKLYKELSSECDGRAKPATFLQLLWIYEGRMAAAEAARHAKKPRRRR